LHSMLQKWHSVMTPYPWAHHEEMTGSTGIVPLISTLGIRFRPVVRFTSQPLWHQGIAAGLVDFRLGSDSLGSTQIHPQSLRDIKSRVLVYSARSYPGFMTQYIKICSDYIELSADQSGRVV
jgi:hypothetical protein